MDVKIRKAKIDDFNEVFILFKQLWPNKQLNEADMLEVFKRGIESTWDEYICAELDGKVIGFCAVAIMNNFWQEGYIAYIYAMIIDEDLRGKGIGTKLLEAAYNTAKDKNCKKIELDSGFQREEAHKFYEKNSYLKRAYLFSKDIIK